MTLHPVAGLAPGWIFNYTSTIMRNKIIPALAAGLCLLALGLMSCSSIKPYDRGEPAVLRGLPGPEDMVLDSLSGQPRLLVSSADRRGHSQEGRIFSVDFTTFTAVSLPRLDEPEGLSFNPHGISLVRSGTGRTLLYVINHRSDREDQSRHSILVYEVLPNHLVFTEELTSPLLVSPNDLCALPDGSIYVSNDSSGKGGMMELILSLKRSTVVHYDGSGKWTVAAEKLAMANGIQAEGKTLYLAVTRENAVYTCPINDDGTLGPRSLLARVKGADNITLDKGYLYAAGHLKDLALAGHMQNPDKKAPSTVFRIDSNSGDSTIVFQDDGSLISAASVAVPHNGSLYIGQIADDGIVRVEY